MLQSQNALIELDCLIDTRLGVLKDKFPLIFDNLDLVAYCNRKHNRLWEVFGLSQDDWMTAWNSRNVEALRKSQPTALLFNLKPIIVSKYLEGKTSPVHESLALSINVFPYNLEIEEQTALIQAVREWTMDDLEIKLVRTPIRKLTPSILKDSFQTVFMMDWIKWLELHGTELSDNRIPTVIINSPAFIADESKELMDVAENESIDPFLLSQQTMAEYVGLSLLAADLFSFPKPHPS